MLRFGIIGTNFISEWFVAACRATEGRAQVAAVCSRDAARAQQFADANGGGRGVDTPEALFELVDAVYVASPNLLHHPQAMAALAAGKHVLVEKTMGTNTAQVDEILTAARANKLVAMEAMRTVHAPAHQLVREHLADLGTIRHARFEKLQYSSRYDAFRAGDIQNAFNPGLGNSALADIGVYCLQPALDLIGAPESTSGASVRLHNGFEGGGSLVLRYPETVVDLAWSKIVSGSQPSVIHGEDGWISLDDPGEPSRIVLQCRGSEPEVLFEQAAIRPAAQMVHEVLDFCDQVEAGRMDERWSMLSLASRRVMDEHLAR